MHIFERQRRTAGQTYFLCGMLSSCRCTFVVVFCLTSSANFRISMSLMKKTTMTTWRAGAWHVCDGGVNCRQQHVPYNGGTRTEYSSHRWHMLYSVHCPWYMPCTDRVWIYSSVYIRAMENDAAWVTSLFFKLRNRQNYCKSSANVKWMWAYLMQKRVSRHPTFCFTCHARTFVWQVLLFLRIDWI